MLHRLHQFRRWAGVDRAVCFSNAAQMMRLVTGPMTMALVLHYLTPEIQGYFYAFSGVVAMQVFLELGFSQNILQFASHEFSKLRFTAAQTLEGDPVARSRLISLGRLAFGYYAVAAVIVLLAVGIGGHVYFSICSSRFSPASFKNIAAFATKLEQQSDSVSKFLYGQLSPQTRQALTDYQASKSNLKILQADLCRDLNAVIKGGRFTIPCHLAASIYVWTPSDFWNRRLTETPWFVSTDRCWKMLTRLKYQRATSPGRELGGSLP